MFDFSAYDVKEPEIHAYKCPECGTLGYPAPMICKSCGERRDPSGLVYSSWDEVPLAGKCELLTWTRVYALPEGYEKPFLVFGVVEFENGLRASGRVEVEGDPETGMELEATVEVTDERGKDANVFVFRKP